MERFAQSGSITLASQHAGISRRTHLNWRKEKRFAAAREEALSIAIDLMEGEARRRALEGTLEPVYYGGKPVGAIRRYSDTLLMFLLKAARPEKYRDNYSGFAEPPQASREELINEIQKKLARLSAQHAAQPPHIEGLK
ncbi:MAG TPA: hypothetical protein VNI35_06925 [Nitrospira sp.]|nr:hypothetical protein [Nitrospira sp.]